MPKYKFTYFNIKGRAEATRLIFVASGVPFEDVRIKFEDWPKIKPNIPGESLPILEVDGDVLTRNVPIARYIARETGMVGKTNWEQAQCDSIVDTCTELMDFLIRMVYEEDEARQEEKEGEFDEKVCPTFLAKMEALLESTNDDDEWITGSCLTWADLVLYHATDAIQGENEEILQDYPKLAAWYKRLADLPRLAKHLEESAEVDMFDPQFPQCI